MAQQTRVSTVDDLDGLQEARAYKFSWQSTTYEVDLSDVHRDELLGALEPYIDAARKTSTKRPRRPARD